jgi:Flp pilus assembly protein TadG
MATSQHRAWVGTKIIAENSSGQAAVEYAIIVTSMLLLLCAVIDFGRALNYMQVMVGLTRQGSNLASRGSTLAQAAASVVSGDAPLDLNSSGEVIVTSVTNTNNANTITGQATAGSLTLSSRIGNYVANNPGASKASVPTGANSMLQAGQTVYVTEIFYTYHPITPIGNLMSIVMPTTLYEAGYF